MIVIDNIEQRSPEWFQARIGIPTASHFDEIVTPTGQPRRSRNDPNKMSIQTFGYMCRLAFETLAGQPYESESQSAFMARGGAMEEEARRWYEFRHDCDVRRVGLILLDDRSAGCSPDGLIGEDGLLEIKVPGGKQHVGYMIEPQRLIEEYAFQVQGQLWITERQWCDLVSYNPLLRPVIQRVPRDEGFITALSYGVAQLNERLQKVLAGEGFDSGTALMSPAEIEAWGMTVPDGMHGDGDRAIYNGQKLDTVA